MFNLYLSREDSAHCLGSAMLLQLTGFEHNQSLRLSATEQLHTSCVVAETVIRVPGYIKNALNHTYKNPEAYFISLKTVNSSSPAGVMCSVA